MARNRVLVGWPARVFIAMAVFSLFAIAAVAAPDLKNLAST